MEVEEIITILSNVENKYFIPVRTMKIPSTIARSYRTYIIQLWERVIGGENRMVFSVEETGLYTDDHKKELVKKAEEKFIGELFKILKSRDGI